MTPSGITSVTSGGQDAVAVNTPRVTVGIGISQVAAGSSIGNRVWTSTVSGGQSAWTLSIKPAKSSVVSTHFRLVGSEWVPQEVVKL